jgi:hypothetical protein
MKMKPLESAADALESGIRAVESSLKSIARSPARRQVISGSLTTAQRMARRLGWLSIGLGATEMICPGALARMLGLHGNETLLRAYGGREILTGVGALSSNPAPAIWARVGGDVLDIATLSRGLDARPQERENTRLAIVAVLGITVLDILCATALSRETARYGQPRDYSDRSGFPRGIRAARGAASGFRPPEMQAALPSGGAASR